MSSSRSAWLATVVTFAIAAVILLGNQYEGYSLVMLAIAAAAASNLR